MGQRQAGLLAIIGVVAAGAVLRCGSVPLTAPGGSSIFAQANPTFVIANGGTSVVTVMVTEPNGMLVPNGTNVYFFTNLGRIDESAQTRDGVTHANFVSDSRSGQATVTIWSGGTAPANTGSTTTTTTTLLAVAPPAGGARALAVYRGAAEAPAVGVVLPMAATSPGTGSATVLIDIGSKLPARVIVTASPDRITSPRHTTIIANVFDAFGNPVQNVPVMFAITSTGVVEETLASGGAPQYTDSNGQAFDVLNTRAPLDEVQRAVLVTATTANGIPSTQISVWIN